MMRNKSIIILIDSMDKRAGFRIRLHQRMRQNIQYIFVIQDIAFSISGQRIRVHFE